jgi:class 3 adenylate cyclase
VFGGAHASDLVPGSAHLFEEYRPWLQFAIDRTNATGTAFSGTVAVELEAANSIRDAMDAVHVTRRWLRRVYIDGRSQDSLAQPLGSEGKMHRGALLTFDLGNSTGTVFGRAGDGAGTVEGPPSARWNSHVMETLVTHLCDCVHAADGAVMSFTGDGLIALFAHGPAPASNALRAVADAELGLGGVLASLAAGQPRQREHNLPSQHLGDATLTLRAALHWGEAYVPVTGKLQDQMLGADVVLVTRLCDFLAKVVEPYVASEAPPAVVGQTGEYAACLAEETRTDPGALAEPASSWEWVDLGDREFKGLPGKHSILHRRDHDAQSSFRLTGHTGGQVDRE